MIQKRDFGALFIGSFAFALLYFFYTFGANIIAGDARPMDNKILWINRFSLLTWIISGYIGALVSKRLGVITGLLLGFLSLIGVSITQYWFGGYNGMIYVLKSDWLQFLFLGIILCSIGGLIWDIQSYLLKRFSNLRLHKGPRGPRGL